MNGRMNRRRLFLLHSVFKVYLLVFWRWFTLFPFLSRDRAIIFCLFLKLWWWSCLFQVRLLFFNLKWWFWLNFNLFIHGWHWPLRLVYYVSLSLRYLLFPWNGIIVIIMLDFLVSFESFLFVILHFMVMLRSGIYHAIIIFSLFKPALAHFLMIHLTIIIFTRFY